MGTLEQLDNFLLHSPVEGFDTRAKHFYPTQASCHSASGNVIGACLRANAFEYWGIPKSNPFNIKTLYTFEMGRRIEAMYIDWFKLMGVHVADHVKFFNQDFFISGELDAVIRENRYSDQLIGWECKSGYSYMVSYQITGLRDGTPPKPKQEHLMQVLLYLEYFPQLPYFILMYTGRDEFDRIEYKIEKVEEHGEVYPKVTYPDRKSYVDYDISLASIHNRYKDLKNYLKKKTLPPRDYNPEMNQGEMQEALEAGKISKTKMKDYKEGKLLTADFVCRYCNFKDLCRGLDKKAIRNYRDEYDNARKLV